MGRKEPLDALAAAAPILDGGKAGPDEIPDRLVGLVGNGDVDEFTGWEETREDDGSRRSVFTRSEERSSAEGGGDDFADDAFCTEMAAEDESRGTGLVDVAEFDGTIDFILKRITVTGVL